MTAATTTRPQTQNPLATQKEQLPALAQPRLPYHPAIEEKFGIDKSGWQVLVDAIFPNATSPQSVLLAIQYCKARNLDPFKRCVHIVPIWSKAVSGMVDSIWPGIGEVRTTAHRTSEYAGHDETVFGPDVTMQLGQTKITFPEWAQMTVYRIVKGIRCPFPGAKVRWLETYATAGRNKEEPNEMWNNRPYGQVEKCAEAAALRAAFPEEIGNDYIPEEVEGRHFNPSSVIDISGMTVPHKPAGKVRRSELNDRTAAPPKENDMPDDRRPFTRDTEAGGSEPDPRRDGGSVASDSGSAADPGTASQGHDDNEPYTTPHDGEDREPGDDNESNATDDRVLSAEALAIEAQLHDPKIDRNVNAKIMNDIMASRTLEQWEKDHLDAIRKANSDRWKKK